MTKTIMILAITVAFVAGSIVTGTIVYAEDGLTKLQKTCSKEPKTPQKIKPDCELLALINAIQGESETQVYEVSDTVVIEAGNIVSPSLSALCLTGDWMNVNDAFANVRTASNLDLNPSVGIAGFGFDLLREAGSFTKIIGIGDGKVQLQSSQVFNVEATVTILCFSPSS